MYVYLITIYFFFPKFYFTFYHFVEYSSDLRLFIRENSEIRYYSTVIFSRRKQYYVYNVLRQPKLLCLLSLLLWTFNSLKSAGEQSTKYNSLRLIYFVRFILFAWLFSLDWAAPRIVYVIPRKKSFHENIDESRITFSDLKIYFFIY